MLAPQNSGTDITPKTLTFRHRFRSGALCEMTVRLFANGMPAGVPSYTWNGPVPKLQGERLDWELNCFRVIAERTGTTTFYGAYLSNGQIKTWRCDPHQKPKRVPFADAVDDSALILAAQNVDDKGNTWPQGGSGND